MSLKFYDFIKGTINTLLTIISFFLILRILFLFFSVNQTTPFVDWILKGSSFLMTPFTSIAPNVGVQTGVLDVVALITLIVYVLIGYMIIDIVSGLERQHITKQEYDKAEAHYHEVEREKESKPKSGSTHFI